MARRCMALRAMRSLLAVLGAAGALAASAGQDVSLSPDLGYQCPDGTQWHVMYCRDSADDANCAVLQLDQPLRNGFQVRTNERRGDMVRRLQACEARNVVLDQGMVTLAGPATTAGAKSATLARETTVVDASGNAVEDSDWGEVEYIGNTDWIRRIGNMDVEYIGNTNWIRRIGNMDVEYIGNTEWISYIGNR